MFIRKTTGLTVASVLSAIELMAGGVIGASAQVYTWTTFLGQPGIAGSDNGTRSGALFNQPTGVAFDAAGNMYVADEQNNLIRKVTPNGVVTTLAGSAGNTGTNDGTGTNALFNQPSNVTLDSAGNIYVADTFNHTIRKITPAGVVSTLAGVGGTYGFKNGTGSGALFNQPNGVAMDISNSFLYVADGENNCIRKVTTNGVVTTPAGSQTSGTNNGTGSAAEFDFPEDVTVDPSGTVYVADGLNNAIRKMTPDGTVSTLAGLPGLENIGSRDGTGTQARFSYPEALRADSMSNVFVADYGNDTIRKVTPAGVVTTVGGQVGIMGTNDGTGTNALFNQQEGVAVDKSGNIYVSDTQSDTIRIGIAPGPVLLGIAQSGGKAVLNWTDTAFSLQSASTAGGSYSNVTTAISPYTNSMSGPQQFFRLKAN
jgi:hypothetical protein